MGLTARAVQRLLAPLKRRVQLLATRAVVRLVDPAAMLQQLQAEALAHEVLDQVEHWEPYGYTCRPHPGAEALLLSLGGRRAHTIALNVADRRFRMKNLAPGEVALYTDEGDVIHFKRGQHIYIDAGAKVTAKAPNVEVIAGTRVLLDTPETEITGNLTVGGTAAVQGALSSATSISDPTGSMQGMRDTYNGHTHPGDSGGTTGAPNEGM